MIIMSRTGGFKIRLVIVLVMQFVLTSLYGQNNIKLINGGVLAPDTDKEVAFVDSLPHLVSKEDLLLRGVRYYNEKEFDRAKRAFSDMLESNPESDAAYYYLAKIAIQQDDIVSAEMLLDKAIGLDCRNYWYRELRAKIYLANKNDEGAVGEYEELISLYPKKMESYYNLANLYLERKDAERGGMILDRIEKIAGKSENTVLARLEILDIAQDWERALEFLIESDTELNSARIETYIGDLYASRYSDSLALAYYRKAQENDANFLPALYGEMELHRRSNNSALFFSKAIPFMGNPMINPNMKSEYLGEIIKNVPFVRKNKAQMDTLFTNLVTAHPSDSTTLYQTALYFAQTGEKERSKEVLRQLISIYPDNANALFSYLTYLYYEKDWETLIGEANIALGRYPDDSGILQMIGISKYELGDTSGAIEAFKKLEEVALRNRDSAIIVSGYATLGDMYHQIGETKLSYSYYDKVLKLDPLNCSVLNNYAYFTALEGKKLKKAEQMSKITIEQEPDNFVYLDTYGWILFLMERKEEAKEYLKRAVLFGGKEDADILDHYAEVLYSLKEYDLAFIYWNQADAKDPSLGIAQKVKERKAAIGR